MGLFDKNIAGLVSPELKKSVEDINKSYKHLIERQDLIVENQNDQIKGIVSIYQLLEAMAKHNGMTDLPKPLIKMELEG